MAIPTTYTGQQSGAAPIYTGSKTESALSQGTSRLIQSKKEEVGVARQDAKDFRESMSVDPIQVANIKLMSDQTAAMKEFVDAGTALMRKRGGKLTEMDRMAIAAGKNALKSKQAQWQGENSQYLNNVKNYSSRPDYFDKDSFEQGQAAYIAGDSGALHSMMKRKGLGVSDFAKGMDAYVKYSSGTKKSVSQNGDVSTYTTGRVWNDDPLQNESTARQSYNNFIQADQRNVDYAIKEFADLKDVNLKKRYLDDADANNDGIISEDEKSNAVLEYGWDHGGKRKFLGESVSQSAYKKTSSDTKADEERAMLKPVNLQNTGISFTDSKTGYGWKPIGDKIMFSESPTMAASKGIRIDKSKLGKLPKGVYTDGDAILVRPGSLDKDGNVEIFAMTGTMKEAEDQDLARYYASTGKGEKKYEEIDGIVYEVSDKNSFNKKMTVPYDSIGSDISSYYPEMQSTYEYMLKDGKWKGSVSVPKVSGDIVDKKKKWLTSKR